MAKSTKRKKTRSLSKALKAIGAHEEVQYLTTKGSRKATMDDLMNYFNGKEHSLSQEDLKAIAKLGRVRSKAGKSILPFESMPGLDDAGENDPESSCW